MELIEKALTLTRFKRYCLRARSGSLHIRKANTLLKQHRLKKYIEWDDRISEPMNLIARVLLYCLNYIHNLSADNIDMYQLSNT